MMTRLGIRAALWGLALGLLAPATTALVLLSGLAAEDVTLTSDLDLWFFFLYLPVAMGLVGVLLRDRRELVVAAAVLGAVTLVELRSYGSTVTDGDVRDAWLTENGSLVLHVLVMWMLLRAAVLDLLRLGPPLSLEAPGDDDLPATQPRDTAIVALALHGVARGVGIGTVAGGAVGTAMLPWLGTAAGAYIGALYGLVPAVAGSLLLAVVVGVRRPTSVIELRRIIARTLAVVGLATMVGVVPVLDLHTVGGIVPFWLLVLVVEWALLPAAGRHLAGTYAAKTWARRERAVLVAS